MCFSAEASFGASAIILTIGAVCVRKSTNVPQMVLSCIPLVFGIQQFSEGILWLSLSHPGFARWSQVAMYSFLVFAQVVWPILVPLAVMLLEKNATAKKLQVGFVVLGLIVSGILAYTLLFMKVQASISCYHIEYDITYPEHFKHAGIFYLTATIVPPILSGIKKLRLLGVVMLLSYIVTRIFYEKYLVSVWCYFAALISIIVLYVIIELNREAQKPADLLPV